MIEARRLTPDQFTALLPEMQEVFREALGHGATESRVLSFPPVARAHARRPGFRAFGAFDEGALVGFVYGCDGEPGHWWYDEVARALGGDGRRWLEGAYELVELHVRPSHQGLGLGGRLHDLVLEGAGRPVAILSTPAREGPAMALYRARGWEQLAEGLLFEGVEDRYRILGLRLGPVPSDPSPAP